MKYLQAGELHDELHRLLHHGDVDEPGITPSSPVFMAEHDGGDARLIWLNSDSAQHYPVIPGANPPGMMLRPVQPKASGARSAVVFGFAPGTWLTAAQLFNLLNELLGKGMSRDAFIGLDPGGGPPWRVFAKMRADYTLPTDGRGGHALADRTVAGARPSVVLVLGP